MKNMQRHKTQLNLIHLASMTLKMSFVPIYYARVVISSSWREIFPFEVIPPLFSPDIAIRIIGSTPFLNPQNIHQHKYLRHQEVLQYLRQNQAENLPWVAIDDIPEHYPPDSPVGAIDDYNGFDQNSAKVLSEYLT